MLVALAAALAVALAVVWTRGGNESRSTLAQLAAKNYRILTPKETRTFLRYAQRERACLARHGVPLSEPIVSRTRILMRAGRRTAKELAQVGLSCDSDVGPPPLKGTLQARRGQVLVYVPKRCLIDPKNVPS